MARKVLCKNFERKSQTNQEELRTEQLQVKGPTKNPNDNDSKALDDNFQRSCGRKDRRPAEGIHEDDRPKTPPNPQQDKTFPANMLYREPLQLIVFESDGLLAYEVHKRNIHQFFSF